MIDSIFLLRCVDCDATGDLSRLWIRASIDLETRRRAQILHYVECLNCGAHMKSQHRDLMEIVGDDEWSRCVGDDIERGTTDRGTPPPPEMQRLN